MGGSTILLLTAIMVSASSAVLSLWLYNTLTKVKNNNEALQKKQKEFQRIQDALVQSQSEIKEQTLKNISWELHDNIGQLLTLAKIQIQNIDLQKDNENLSEAIKSIAVALDEVRALSRSINSENLEHFSLIDNIQSEINRFNRLRFIKGDLLIIGEPFSINCKDEIILFRILQEFFTNTIKHSRALSLYTELKFRGDILVITSYDNGIGFNPLNVKQGLGLQNMKNRAELIGANLTITSNFDEGVHLRILYPKKSA